MKRILIPISFSKASKNSLHHAVSLFSKAQLTLLYVYPVQKYSRKYDFGKKKYSIGIKEKLREFYQQNIGELPEKIALLAHAGTTSQTVNQISSRYDLMVMSRKAHPSKKHGYLSDKKLFLTTKAHCPVLILPITNKSFNFKNCEHAWHIKRSDAEPIIVAKGMAKLQINPERMEVKTLQQRNFLSSFWRNIIAYENSHEKKLLKKIDKAHDAEPIDLIIVVDNEPSIFTNFLKSDIVRIFCEYEIPILVFPA